MIRKRETITLFYCLLALTGFFFLLEISFFIQANKAYLGDYRYVTTELQVPLAVVPGILFFVFAECLVHVVFVACVGYVTVLLCTTFQPQRTDYIIPGVLVWCVGLCSVLVLNQYYYPHSKFAELTQVFLGGPALKLAIALIDLMGLVLMVLSLIVFLQRLRQRSSLCRWAVYGACVLLVLSLVPFSGLAHRVLNGATDTRPNIIIIGIDSLRPDFLGYFNQSHATPFIDSFLQQATVFNNAFTPLARTFPAWASLLTGEHPLKNGIRSNLMSTVSMGPLAALPSVLKQQGYDTVFATDESRFSNLDSRFGFDQVIAPPMGLNDFLLGTFNDFPLSNLIVNTALGRFLFPYSYANRAAFLTYRPESFLSRLKHVLNHHRSRPLFLAVHFCLPHYPYLWSASDAEHLDGPLRYAASIGRVDAQVRDFYTLLERNGVLQSAIVVMVSDHGEALELPGDRITQEQKFIGGNGRAAPRFYPPTLHAEGFDQSAGHGTDVLGLSQYHVLMAFRGYGCVKNRVQTITTPVTLLDIKPTLLGLLSLTEQDHVKAGERGMSLLRFITERAGPLIKTPRPLFLESDFSPAAIRTVYPDMRGALLSGVHLFQIDPRSTRVTIKHDMLEKIIKSKQYAVVYDGWVLALYPQDKDRLMPILVDLSSKAWTNDLDQGFARRSPVVKMLHALQQFYGGEVKDKLNR